MMKKLPILWNSRCSAYGLLLVMVSLYTLTRVVQFSKDVNTDLDKNPFDPQGEHVLANLRNFSFVKNSDICKNTEVSVIFVVPSHPLNKEFRDVLRSVYNRVIQGHKSRVVFLQGTMKNAKVQKAMDAENALYHDIIQGNFEDSYRSVTYNHLQGLKWSTTYCKNAEYIVKVDDDIYLNLELLFKSLYSHLYQLHDRIFCSLWVNATPKRAILDKYYVSYKEYSKNQYPTYCNGWVVVYPQHHAKNLLITAATIPFFWMSDVFITGICTEKEKVTFHDMNPNYTYNVQDLKNWLEEGVKLPNFIAGPVGKDVKLLQQMHIKSDSIRVPK